MSKKNINNVSLRKIKVSFTVVDFTLANLQKKIELIRNGKLPEDHQRKSLAEWMYIINLKFKKGIESH